MRIDEEVLAVLSNATTEGNKLILAAQLERKLYLQTAKVLEAAGGIWNRKAKAHVFADNAADRMEQIILTGQVAIPKDEYDFFESPPTVVQRLLQLAELEPGMRVLEPEAGGGNIAYPCAEAGAIVDVVELQEGRAADLSRSGRLNSCRQMDFLALAPEALYDRVLMNPPFSKRADIKHVTHAHKFLKPGGKLVSVMPSGAVYRIDSLARQFREFVEHACGHFEPLPAGSFVSSGTGVNTVVAVIPA